MLLDISLKYLLGARPQRLFEHVCGARVVKLAPTEWQATQLRPDLFGQLENGAWLHAEVACDPLAEMPWRMLGYLWLAWHHDRIESLIQVVFVLRGRSAKMPDGLDVVRPSLRYRYQVVFLEDIDVSVLAGGTPEESVLSVLCRGGSTPERVREVLGQCLELPKGERDMLIQHLQVLSGLRPGLADTVKKELNRAMPLTIDLRENLFWQEATAAGHETGFRQGREQGWEQGREEGRAEEARLFLRRLLTQRFGPLPDAIAGRLATAGREQLEQWSDRLLSASSLDDLFQ